MRTRSGQTLLELVIASGVIVTAVASSATLITNTISAGRISQSNIEAGNFAREGVEIVRSFRDSNWLRADRNITESNGKPIEWDDTPCPRALAFCSSANNYVSLGGSAPPAPVYYAVDSWIATGGWQLRLIGSNTPQKICYRQAGTKYHFQPTSCVGSIVTRFSRVIQIVKDQECIRGCPSAGGSSPVYVDRLRVTSTVVWNERAGKGSTFAGFNRSLVAEAYLYKWR